MNESLQTFYMGMELYVACYPYKMRKSHKISWHSNFKEINQSISLTTVLQVSARSYLLHYAHAAFMHHAHAAFMHHAHAAFMHHDDQVH